MMRNLRLPLFLFFCIWLNAMPAESHAAILQDLTPLHGGCITSGNQTIQPNTAPGTILATIATGSNCEVYAYQWQVSTDNLHFYDIAGATSQNLAYAGVLSQSVYFQRKAICNGEMAFSNSISVVVSPT